MAVIKCKMCGGDIILNEGKTFGTCEYCGSNMTLPKVSDEQRAALFNRGNHFRRTGEFDKALAIYENIVREDDTDAEAHWCCALCRFGIEYVEDPNTYEYIPTCHRASFDSFLEDVDYLAAVENSEGLTRKQYQRDGAKIAEVQKGILATSQNEEPFDVFICYKETDDETKQRTRDSIDAQEIYYRLTDEGCRVFFSRITLEDKAGTEYEPYIFAALNSAKVMVAIGSKPEYFNAVWVKNEWSRFLALMRKDRSKLLIPCYKNMDPYDLPDQLSVLQSYDMTKIGFVQDLIRGIEKLIKKNGINPMAAVGTIPTVQTVAEIKPTGPLIKRISIFVTNCEWNKAYEYCEKVLDMDPDCAAAYFYGVIAGYKTGESVAVYANQLETLIERLDPSVWNAITQNNCVDSILAFAEVHLYEICENIMKRFPDFHETVLNNDDNTYNSLLSYVVDCCFDIKLVKLMLKFGADPNTNRKHSTGTIVPVADDAIWNKKSPELLKLLLDNGADPNGIRLYQNEHGTTEYSLLSDAIWNANSVKMVKLLLERGADPNRMEDRILDNGNREILSMLSTAVVFSKQTDMVKLLLEYGADPNSYRIYFNKYGENHYSALGDAIWNIKNTEIAEILLKHGANVNAVETVIEDDGYHACYTMLANAVIYCRKADMVKLLFRYGATMNHEIRWNNTSKLERKFPYAKFGIPNDVLAVLRENGWKMSIWS